ncbi:MAG: UDP-N-acetylmuramoyl-L-alanine--D-glutamate ligase [Balneolaceae bacterium]|nr:UDP-N-acetylmuramoyl-L-alanine--D-glutamate ligase [Balneolaceae bacterium]MCH8547729.1 UDP-N-acetylmuramoyl-L-alanine--D-glutamate ligase [Balneolaceae bacterium]
MRDLKGQHIVVAGAARSGVAAAMLLKQQGAVPFISDFGEIKPEYADRLEKYGIEFESNQHSERALEGELLVLSPGVPTESSIARTYLADGKQVCSEIELASWFNRSPIVAVTGSNGKTTVTSWMEHIWKTAGREFLTAGNIGTAFSELVDQTGPEKTVLLEVSSFQLDHIDTFHPDVSVILNITPDHLDRYGNSIEAYAASKLGIVRNQTSKDWFICNADDARLAKFKDELSEMENSPRILTFSTKKEVEKGAFVRNGQIILKTDNKEEILMNVEELALPGHHNLSNGMASALAARALEISNEAIRESLRIFEGVAHRLEFVRSVDGVRYINDSKATNINAVWYALDSFQIPITLILGGRDKGNDYRELAEQINSKVHTVIAIGEAREKIKEQLGDMPITIKEAESMKEAVKLARKGAKRGELVLMSPACSSFDMFDDYRHRGDMFKQAVLEL